MNKKPRLEENQEKLLSIFEGQSSAVIQEVLLQKAKVAVLEMAVTLLEEDANRLCGRPFSRKGECLNHRGGSERSSIIVGGAKYPITRPRVRGEEGEVELPTLSKLRDQDLLDEHMKNHMLLGVSSRNYDKVVEGYSDKLGISRSSVSRAFIRASQKELDKINTGDLSSYSFVAVMVDGLEVAGRMIVVALGITADMNKIPIGLKEGDTENTQVVTDLLSTIVERGFTLHCEKILGVIDGSKALKKALYKVFGERLVLQRCWLHKYRNIKAYLPDVNHKTLLWKMKKLMGLKSLADAQKEYDSLLVWLRSISDDAASSLEEAGAELLTLHRLNLVGELRKSLSSTNLIESLISVVRTKTRNVKNWNKGGTRWAAAAIAQHKPNMRKLRGFASANQLIFALRVKAVEKLAA